MSASYMDMCFASNPVTREAQASWYELMIQLAKTAREFRNCGHIKEATQIEAYSGTFRLHALRHLERLMSGKDSSVGTEPPGLGSAASEDPIVNSQAPADMTGADVGGGCGQSLVPPGDDAAAATTPDDSGVFLKNELSLVERCEIRMMQVAALMRTNGDQRLEVALSFLSRARDLARRKHPTAEARLLAAENVLHGQETGT